MENVKILFIGDVVGEISLHELKEKLPRLIQKYGIDFTVVNGENIWEGKGLNEIEANMLFKAGADVITTGNHVWENWKSRPLLENNRKVLRPLNYPPENPGEGFYIASKKGLKIAVLQLQGRTYMQPIDCPFNSADIALEEIRKETNIIIVDFHAEATAEKSALGWHLDGRVSAVIGTHTHIQTADASILPGGTAYLTDVGMTGPYDSVLGMKKEIALKRFQLQTAHKYEVAENDLRIACCIVSVDTATGHASGIKSFMEPEFEKGTV